MEPGSVRGLPPDGLGYAEVATRPAPQLAFGGVGAASDRIAAEVPAVIGESAAMRHAMELAKRAAGANIPVLLSGETGTGKSLLAGFLHRHSLRRDAPFIAQNCGALPETLCESELFGYRRGAFTGAVQDKTGPFEAADGGTIFLDEVSELGLAAQVKLLQVLQEGFLRRLGDTRSRSVDVRVIAATNKDLCAEIQRGSFREDLYYRLNVVSIVVPSLRERPEDIPRLASHFLLKHGPRINPKVNRLGGEALGLLSAYHYPGNVRELENLIQRALLFTTGPYIEPGEWFPARGRGGQAATGSSLADLEHRAVLSAIALHEGNLTRVAHTLGISRTTLWRRIKGYRSSSGARSSRQRARRWLPEPASDHLQHIRMSRAPFGRRNIRGCYAREYASSYGQSYCIGTGGAPG